MLCSVCVKAEWASLSLSEELDEWFQRILVRRDCRLSSAIVHQDDKSLQNPVRQILSLFRLTEQLKKGEVEGSSSTTDSLQAQLNWTEVQRSLHSHSKTKSGTELSTFPAVRLNFILTAKEINCHMPPDFLLQTSCAMLQKPQQKLAQVSWLSAWLGLNCHRYSRHTKPQHNIKTQTTISLKSRIQLL